MTSDEVMEIIDDHRMYARFGLDGQVELTYVRVRGGDSLRLDRAADKMVRAWLGKGGVSISLIKDGVYYVTNR